MPVCSSIYFEPFNSQNSFEVPIYLDLARNGLSVLREKCLKDQRSRLKRLLGHQALLQNIFDESKEKQIRFTEATFFLMNMSLITRSWGWERERRGGEVLGIHVLTFADHKVFYKDVWIHVHNQS